MKMNWRAIGIVVGLVLMGGVVAADVLLFWHHNRKRPRRGAVSIY